MPCGFGTKGTCMTLVADRIPARAGSAHDDSDIAAWTLRSRGSVSNWRDDGLEANLLIGPWAICALADGRAYADLLYSELDALAAQSN